MPAGHPATINRLLQYSTLCLNGAHLQLIAAPHVAAGPDLRHHAHDDTNVCIPDPLDMLALHLALTTVATCDYAIRTQLMRLEPMQANPKGPIDAATYAGQP